jgi:stalled ribosome rescue protein Dom34
MKSNAGLWIDHREALIVVLKASGEETKRIQSAAERQPRRLSEPSDGTFKGHQAPSDDARQNEFQGQLAHYYAEVVAHLQDAGAILIFGPGEAKGELRKQFDKHKSETRSITVESADKMTEHEVAARVRHHFQEDAARRGTK